MKYQVRGLIRLAGRAPEWFLGSFWEPFGSRLAGPAPNGHYVVGHTVERVESAVRAEELIRETIARNGIVPETVHADRGTSMTSKKVSQLLIDLGVTRSHSRPKTSNDNPYSEAHSKTTKHMSDYPERFDSLAHAREWFDAFIAYYNHEHRHSGIGWHTPASVHFGTAEGGPRPAGRHPRRGIRPPPRTLRPPPPTTPDTPAGMDQRPGQAQGARTTNLIASRPSHWT
ncbi:integrase core domain-containing protein [Streptomyces sasae]|uniref:integrase core domain-containing protein n=1 Tax=Streptomyces sasae TaxID=1266772 RepID=UPI002930C7A0|nr:integrase core domain-containing protein [Streptomyces sasae]